MAHGQWTEVEARSVLEAWRRSGLSIDAFARGRGLVPQRLHWWRKKLAASKAISLVPVRVAESAAAARARRGEPVTVMLRSGHMLKVGHDFDEQAFSRVVAILERA